MRMQDGIVPTPSQHGTRRRWEVSTTLQPLYPGKDPVPAGWEGLGPVWTDIYLCVCVCVIIGDPRSLDDKF